MVQIEVEGAQELTMAIQQLVQRLNQMGHRLRRPEIYIQSSWSLYYLTVLINSIIVIYMGMHSSNFLDFRSLKSR